MKFDLTKLNIWFLSPLAIATLQFFIFQLASQGQLPNPMAIHWGIAMQPDGFVSISQFALTLLIFQLIFWIPALAASLWLKTKVRIKNLLLLVLGIIFWITSLLVSVSLFIQIGANDAEKVQFPVALFAIIVIFIPVILVFFLSMPEIVVADNVDIKLRGLTIMSFTPEEIVSVSEGVVSAREFGGLGIRFTARKIGFVPSKGPAVKLNLQDGTEVSIRSNDPMHSIRLIEDLIS